MRTNIILALVIGALIVLVILTLIKLNKVEGLVEDKSTISVDTNSANQRAMAKEVNAKDLVSSIQENLNSVSEVNLKFYDKTNA